MTLTSDFGTRDSYVAAMKAVLIRDFPAVRLIDITHEVSPQDLLSGSIALERAVNAFFPGTVHLAVVDPGVGTERRILIVELNQQVVVCPDNGLITWAWRRCGPGRAFELIWRPAQFSHTFHGRDVMAPIAALIARGKHWRHLARPINDPKLMNVTLAETFDADARIIHLDHFGNATTNLPHDGLEQESSSFTIKGKSIGPLRRTYQDVAPGRPLALIGSSGLLEIAIRDGSAALKLGLKVGDRVGIKVKSKRMERS